MRERAKAGLFDLSFCPLVAHILSELAPNEGIKHLIEAYQAQKFGLKELLSNLCQDLSFRVKLKGSIPHKLVLMGQGKDLHEFDFINEIQPGIIDDAARRKFYSIRQLMDSKIRNYLS